MRLLAMLFVLVLAGCTTGSDGSPVTSTGPTSSTTTSSPPASPVTSVPVTSTPPARPNTKVHLRALQSDGSEWGIGMPIILFATPAPTDSTEFTKNVTVTVNGEPAEGAWYWEYPSADEKKAHTIQAHYRPKEYWPPDSEVKVELNLAGKSAGKGLEYDGKLTSLDFTIGDAHISKVDASDLRMTVYDDNEVVKTVPVSLGAAATPTFNGTKIVMQKGEQDPKTGALRKNGTVLMCNPQGGYCNDPVPWSVRITNSGEYVHAAGWNTHIGERSTSNGCTNLKPADGEWFYKFSNLGDVVEYVGTKGEKMPPLDGYGDWNIAWPVWQRGGELLNH
jgi:lipoprotein-anchoring transpeptidase ErfK/SrfK